MAAAAVIDINHPYYLSPSDHPGISLVSEVLTDQNYHHWSRSIKIALSAKLKVGFIDGTQPSPAANSPQLGLWQRSNDLVISWILNSVSTEIRKSIVYMHTAKQIWDDLLIRYSQHNVPRLFNLRKDLASISQGTSSITTYFTHFRGLMDELENLAPVPRCICAATTCTCTINDRIIQYELQIKLSQFLMGLNDQFMSTRGQILLMQPLPDLSQAYAMLLQDENQRNNVHNISIPSDNLAMNVRFSQNTHHKSSTPIRQNDKKGNDVVCDYCNKSGHDREVCYALHGYPEWHKLYGQPKPKPRFNNNRRSASAAQTTSQMPSPAETTIPPTTQHSSDTLSESQMHQLIKMLQSKVQNPATAPWLSNNTNHVAGTSDYHTNSIIFASHVQRNHPAHIWILDSGATHHITPYLHLVDSPIPVHSTLHLPNGEMSIVTHIGKVTLSQNIVLKDVLVVPTFNCNLLSIPYLTKNTSFTVLFSSNKCLLQDPASMMVKEIGNLADGLYKFQPQFSPIKAAHSTGLSTHATTFINKWHCRLGHPSSHVLGHIKCLSIPKSGIKSDCEICHMSKQTRLPFPIRESSSKAVFDVIHCDVWGPYRHHTHGSCTKFLTVVDDFSKCTWVFLMHSKTQVPVLIKDFISYVTTQFNKTIKIIRSDNGSEFSNADLHSHLTSLGILQQFSCSHTPQQNGTVERKHQHLLNVARSLRFQAKLPISLWGDCVLTATHLINLLPSPVLNYKCPYDILFETPPDYSSLKIFGCLCYISNLYSTPDKFASKSLKCVFLGYPFNKKGYKVMELHTRKIHVSRDVHFIEDQFPFHDIPHTCPENNSPSMFPLSPFHEFQNSTEVIPIPLTPHSPDSSDTNNSTRERADDAQIHIPVTIPLALSKPVRTKQLPARYKDFAGLPGASISPSAGIISGTPLTHKCTYPIQNYMSYHAFSPKHQSFLCNSATIHIPSTFKQAALDSNWLIAMKNEIHAMESNFTWELVPRPKDKHIVDCKWLFKVKYLPDGSVDRYKARLVAKGFTQTFGLDYFETFAPVAKMATVRTFIAVAADQNWPITQFDVTNAFLHGDLHEEVFMRVPPGYLQLSSLPAINNITDISEWVCKLRKSIYGLRQAPRCWFTKFMTTLKHFGFIQSHADNSLFTFHADNQFIAVLVYVDDILITGTSKNIINQVFTHMASAFKVKDLGSLRYFLGIEAARNQSGIYIHQRKYTLDILQDTGLSSSKPSKTPMEQNHNLHQNSSPLLADADVLSYRRLVGRLIYLTVTRPDLAYSVQILSQFVSKPRHDHLNAAYRVVRYLKGSPGQGIFMAANSTPSLTAFCDSDWGGCKNTRHSLTGYCVKFGETVISWRCKKQHTVSRSSAEAEYRSMADTCCEITWLLSLLRTFGYYKLTPVTLACDSKSALYIASNPVFHERTKHIEIDCHLVREKLQLGIIQTTHIASNLQPADMFTKPLASAHLRSLLSKLGICNLFKPPT